MKIVVFLGAPGSGKGTIASRMAEANETWRHVSSGDLLRDAVKRQTAAGNEAGGYMKRGELVPDVIVGQMIGNCISGVAGADTMLLDGFPRTVAQAEILDIVVARCGAELAAVILLEVADDIIVERIAGRRNCPKCGAGYHVKNIPSRVEGVCDVCGTGLVVRKDDNPETVKNRLSVYKGQTVPLIDFYGVRGLLRRVDGTGRIDDTVQIIRQTLA